METVSQSGNIEQHVIELLAQLLPSDIVKSEPLLTSFKDLFTRCSPDEFLRLVPDHHKDTIATRHGLSIVPSSSPVLEIARKATHTTSKRCPLSTTSSDPPSSHRLRRESRADGEQPNGEQPNGEQPNGEQPESPEKYFETKNVTAVRRRRLVRATEGFLKANTHLDDASSYEELWAAKKGLFAGGKSESTLCRLLKGLKELKKRKAEYGTARAISSLYVSYEVDEFDLTCGDLKLVIGRSRKTVVLNKVAEREEDITEDELRDKYWNCRGYLQLLELMGPGIFFFFRFQVFSDWEGKISEQEVVLIVEYLRLHRELYKRSRALNEAAANVFIKGLIDCGRNRAELLKSKTPLIRELKKYINTTKPPISRPLKRSSIEKPAPLGGQLSGSSAKAKRRTPPDSDLSEPHAKRPQAITADTRLQVPPSLGRRRQARPPKSSHCTDTVRSRIGVTIPERNHHIMSAGQQILRHPRGCSPARLHSLVDAAALVAAKQKPVQHATASPMAYGAEDNIETLDFDLDELLWGSAFDIPVTDTDWLLDAVANAPGPDMLKENQTLDEDAGMRQQVLPGRQFLP